MKRYENGELITKERMEDEDWYYSLYQPFLHIVCYGSKALTVDGLYNDVIKNKVLGSVFAKPEHHERLLRWCVLHVERKVSPEGQMTAPTPRLNFDQIYKVLSNCNDLNEAKMIFNNLYSDALHKELLWEKFYGIK